ncbi:MAG: response regulator transcription factor [Phycisphaerales bacterium]|nr:response regulator transcription factor [Phycisphaerales bacterium]
MTATQLPSMSAACRLAFVGHRDWRRLPQLDALRRHHRTRSVVEIDIDCDMPETMHESLDAALVQALDPPSSAIRWVERLASEPHRTRCVVVTPRLEEPLLALCVSAGAWGILPEESPAGGYVSTVANVLAGRLVFPDDVLDRIVSHGGVLSLRKSDTARAAELPRDERLMLQLLADGLTAGHVAARLGIAPQRARRCRKRLMDRLKLPNDAALIRFAIRAGIINP